ncbi:MAG: hypothetical protein ACREJP_05630, partial [Candidatus Methylomirabilales bacterium]
MSTALPHDQPPTIRGLKALGTYVRFVRDPIPVMRSLCRDHGRLIMFDNINPWSRREQRVVIAIGPEYNQQILNDPNIFRARGMVLQGPQGSAHQRIRFGLISMNAEQHRQQRQLVMPLFHKKRVEGYGDAIFELTTQMLDSWREGEQRDIWRDMQALA